MAKQPPKRRAPAKRPPKPELTVEIERLNDEGVGIGRHEGKEAWVAGALAGETVRIEPVHEGQRRLVGRLRRVLEPSPQRTPSPCKASRACLGCSLIEMKYPAQLQFKQQRVEEALSTYPALKGTRLHPILGAERRLGYRTTAKLAIAKERGKVRVGLFRRGSHEVVDIGDCPLHHPLINRIVAVVREEIERQKVYVYDPRRRRGLLRYLLVKVSPAMNQAMVTFVTTERNYREVTHLAKWLTRKLPEVVSVQQNVNASAGNVILGRETLKILGGRFLPDRIGELRLSLSPASFFQVNHEQASRIYALVRQWAALKNGEEALDLYCGIGGIALHLAADAAQVTGIEMVEDAVANARVNARLNGLENCTFRAGDVASVLRQTALPPASVAVLNPPRSGCDAEVLETLAALAPRAILYVSCNPVTLARDLDLLRRHGYRTAEVQPVDMFPQTAHVESVARLERAAPAAGPKKKGRR